MDTTLTKAVLRLEPHDRLELAQMLIESVQSQTRVKIQMEFTKTERLDLQNRLQIAQTQPLSGRDLQGFFELFDTTARPS